MWARTKELEERNAEVLQQAETVQTLSSSLMHVQDDERRHIARELHDSAGQTLTVLGMNLATVAERAGAGDPQLREQVSEAQKAVEQLTQEIRTASYLLHPPLLDEIGVAATLKWYVEGLVERSGLKINLDLPQDLGRFSRDAELVVFRVVQECLTNIHRHSGSKTAAIRLRLSRGIVSVEVQDSGKGMSAEKLTFDNWEDRSAFARTVPARPCQLPCRPRRFLSPTLGSEPSKKRSDPALRPAARRRMASTYLEK